MHRLALILLLACAREDKAPPPEPAPAPAPPAVAPKVIDATVAIDAPHVVDDAVPIDVTVDAPAKLGKPGGVKGTVMFRETTPANQPSAPVADCTVLATDEATKQRFTTKSNAKGEYRLELPPGTYRVDLGGCKRGSLDCANPKEHATSHVVIDDGNWPTFSMTSHSCNKCLDASAPIATPDGPVAIDHLRTGDRIYVIRDGKRIVTTVAAMQRIPATALARRLVLADGRIVIGSAPHPLGDGRAFGTITANDIVDGARVERVELVPYRDGHAYDILPALDGAYLVDGVPVRSTMSP